MDFNSLKIANALYEKLKYLKSEKEIWENAKELCGAPKVSDGNEYWNIQIELIDFTELKNRTLANIDSKIEALEKEFKEL